jgi:hypothetical protein
MSEDTRLPDDSVHTATNQQKLDDIWWEARSTTGAGEALLNQGIPKLGPDWKPVPGVHTTPATELGALPQNFANLRASVDALKASIPVAVNAAVAAAVPGAVKAALAGTTPAAVDPSAIAKAVATELAARLTKGA